MYTAQAPSQWRMSSKLDLHQLEGLEAADTISIFFDIVEQCTEDDDTRVQIVKSRVMSDLAMLLYNSQSKGKCNSRGGIKRFLENEFAADINLDRA